METLESLRDRVAAYERERARLYGELAAPVRDPHLSVVKVAVLGLLALSFAFGFFAGETSTGVRRHADPWSDPDRPLPTVRLLE